MAMVWTLIPCMLSSSGDANFRHQVITLASNQQLTVTTAYWIAHIVIFFLFSSVGPTTTGLIDPIHAVKS